MNYIEDIEDKVKSLVNAFRDHKAELTQCGTLSTLDWRRPGTGVNAVRFVFDSGRYNAVYITGDLGQAIIRPTCRASLWEMAICFTSRTDKLNVNVGYFMEKMATSGDRYEWTSGDWIEDFKKHCEDDGLIPPEDFIEDVEGIWSSPVEFYDDKPPHISEKARQDLEKMDPDYWEWVYDCGKRVNAQVIAWLVALRLAYEQLASAQTDGKRMTHKEIQGVLSDAHHEICHAYAFVGTPGRELSALQAIDRARDGLSLAYDALNTLEDDALAARRER